MASPQLHTHELTVGLAMHLLSFHDRAMKIY